MLLICKYNTIWKKFVNKKSLQNAVKKSNSMSKKKLDTTAVVTASPKPYKNPANYHEFPQVNEPGGGISLTRPDEAMTVKEIMARYTRGLPIVGAKVPIYDGDDTDLPDIRKLDLSEIQELREKMTAEIEEIKSNYQKAMKEKQAADAKEAAEMKEAFEEWRKQKKDSQDKNPA